MTTRINDTKEFGTMKRIGVRLFLTGILLASLAACQEARDERSYVQTNVLRKDVLEGEWFYSRWVQEHTFESSYFTFKGDSTWDYGTSSMARVRFIIDENYLVAVRTYEVVANGTMPPADTGFIGEPLAAFPIEKHFDIQRQYNPSTGEVSIVTDENSRDRMWWEREYMRVDWTTNNVLGYYWASLDAYQAFGYVEREPAAWLCDEGSDCPASWQVEVATAECPDTCRDVMRVPAGMEGDFAQTVRQCGIDMGATQDQLDALTPAAGGPLTWADLAPYWTRECEVIDDVVDNPTTGETPPYYLSFVTQEVWSPAMGYYGFVCAFQIGVPCTSFRVAVRNTFLRSGPVPDYEPINVNNTLYDRFGIIRLAQQVYIRGNLPDEEEGITRDYGITDALNYWGARHDLWANDLEVGPDGRRMPGKYRPMGRRAVRPITYTLSKHFPPYLVEPSMRAAWQWNETLMGVVRQVRNQPLPSEGGAPWACQLVHPTCPAGNPQCDPHDISEFGGRLDQWDESAYQHRMEGPECALRLQANPCDVDPDQPCAEIGDIRHHFWALIDTPGAYFAGVSLPIQDMRNGRLVSANVNITQESIEDVPTSIFFQMGLFAPEDLTHVDWQRWILTEDQLMSAEYKRDYFANLGLVEHPHLAAPYGPVATEQGGATTLFNPMLMVPPAEMDAARTVIDRLEEKAERLRGMEGRAMTLSNRVGNLAGSQFERNVMDVMDTLNEYGDSLPRYHNSLPNHLRPTDEQVLDAVSPFRTSFADRIKARRDAVNQLADARHCFLPLEGFEYVDDAGIVRFAREFGTYSPAQVALWIRWMVLKGVFVHEFGHSIGMEHNFGASADPSNYHREWYEIASRHPMPDFREYETCSTTPDPYTGDIVCGYTGEDLNEYWADVRAAKEARELDGIDYYQYSSVMDYAGDIFGYTADLGPYDTAYALFTYGLRREVYNGDPRSYPFRSDSVVPYAECASGTGGLRCTHECTVNTDGTVDCPWLRKLPFVYYIGGQTCETDNDCPFSRGKGNLYPGDAANGIPAQEDVVAQRCVENYRQRELDASAPPLPRICSNYDEDWRRFVSDRTVGGDKPFYGVMYKNCGNSRVDDISWCTMHDEGSSFREVVENKWQSFDRNYLLTHFRRYRNMWGGSSLWGTFDLFGKIYQHFWYRLWYEGGDFDLDEAPHYGYGAWDQLLSAGDALNFMASVIATPDVGSYRHDTVLNAYLPIGSEEMGIGDLDIEPGLGKYQWSRFEEGLEGYFRQARQGLIRNKLEAMMALVLREWGMTYGMDERYYFNFYDMYTTELNMLFGSLMLDNPSWYAPRMTGTPDAPRLAYPQLWQGFLCGGALFGGGYPNYCNPDPRTQFDPSIPSVASSNDILRNYAVAFALAEFPVFFDTSYEQQMYVALDGGGDYFEIQGCDPQAMQAADVTENDACVLYVSPRLHKTYVAAKVEPREPWSEEYVPLSYSSVSAELLHQMNVWTTLLDQLDDPATPSADLPEECRSADGREECQSRYRTRLQRDENLLISLIDMMHKYGISSWF